MGLLWLTMVCQGMMVRAAAESPRPLSGIIRQTQAKVVKIYGAGGPRGLEEYQSGIFISETGHILTVWSYVLDTDYITVVPMSGVPLQAKLVGADPQLDIAILKVSAESPECFALNETVSPSVGTRVLAFSNLFGVAAGDEWLSVQHGVVAAQGKLTAAVSEKQAMSPYPGKVILLDAMTNNPGAAGGALIDTQGHLLGMLGKEQISQTTGVWVNYALPISEIAAAAEDLLKGKPRPKQPTAAAKTPIPLAKYGLQLVPDILEHTPPYIDAILVQGPAAKAGLAVDDLIVYVGDQLVTSCRALQEELARADRDLPLRLAVMRGRKLVSVELPPPRTLGDK
jgi:serine protease Do